MKRLINTLKGPLLLNLLPAVAQPWMTCGVCTGTSRHIHAGFRSIRVNEFLERGAYGPPRFQFRRWSQRFEIRQSNKLTFLFSRCVSVWSAVTWQCWQWSSHPVIYPDRGETNLAKHTCDSVMFNMHIAAVRLPICSW